MNILKDTYNGFKTITKLEEAPSQIKDLSKRVAELESQNAVQDEQIKTLTERMTMMEKRAQQQADDWQKNFSEALVQLKVLALDNQRCREELKEALEENRNLVQQVFDVQTQLRVLLMLFGPRPPLSLPPAG